MLLLWIAFGVAVLFALAALITAYVCFYRIFYSPEKRRRKITSEKLIPEEEIYLPFKEKIVKWIEMSRTMPHADVSIKSFDGLTLRGRYYECEKGAPIEILFHGYKGTSERDLSGGISRCFALGRNALLVDHRASGRSEGSVISFGINESRDCELWIDYVINNIDMNAKIIITGVSMGAATVMISAAKELPENVVGVLADCGYTSAKEIIKKVIREMGLPADLLYPFARLGGKIFGRFDVDETSPIEAMKKSRLPIIFIHGDADDFVPFEMSEKNYEACISEKRLVKISGAGHGLCFPTDKEKYLCELKEFFDPILNK